MELVFSIWGYHRHVKCQTNSQITTQCIAKINVCLFSFCLRLGREAKDEQRRQSENAKGSKGGGSSDDRRSDDAGSRSDP